MPPIICGIDPGLQGAIAFLNSKGKLMSIEDIPTIAVKKGKSTKMQYLIPALAQIFRLRARPGAKDLFVALEFVHAMPEQGVTSMFRMGRGVGIIEGILAALEIPYCTVAPQTWKRALIGVGATIASGSQK